MLTARLCWGACMLVLIGATVACGDDDGGTSTAAGGSTGVAGAGGNGGAGGSPALQYLLIEDISSDTSGSAPGADVDAICLEKAAGSFCATQAISFNFGDSDNAYNNVLDLLGAPDADCEVQNFVALGGMAGDGYAIVVFGTPNDPVLIEPGDVVQVYELGPSNCPSQPNWLDDPVQIGVSADSDRASFTTIGSTQNGMNSISVP